MKHLITYLECGEAGYSTPANTMGMGNPGQTDSDTLTEPIGGVEKTAKALKQNDRKKKKKFKSLAESLFDTDLVSKDMTFGDIFKLEDVNIRESIERPSHRGPGMIPTKFKIGDMYKSTLLSKDTDTKVTKDSKSIADALNKIV